MDHRKAERVSYHFCIRDFWSFSQFDAQKLRSIVPLFCPEIEFSSNINR
jgi:hypothetical protein